MTPADTGPGIPAPSTRGARVLKAAMGLLLLLIGSGGCLLLIISYQRGMVTRTWNEVPCSVVDARMEESGDNANSEYRIYLRYLYDVDGREYTGTRWRRIIYQGHRAAEISRKSAHKTDVAALMEQYPPGTKIVCYVNPQDPTDAVLEHQSRAALYTLWWPLIFAMGGVGIMWSAFRKKVARG